MELTLDQIIMLLLLAGGRTTTRGMNIPTFLADVDHLRKLDLILVRTLSLPVLITQKGKAVVAEMVKSTSVILSPKALAEEQKHEALKSSEIF